MLKALDDLVESRIRDAQQRGEFSGLPGEGRPLPEEDLAGVPDDLRVAYRLLKSAGLESSDVAALRDVDGLLQPAEGRHATVAPRGSALPQAADASRRRRGERRLLVLTLALQARGQGPAASTLRAYRDRLVERLGR